MKEKRKKTGIWRGISLLTACILLSFSSCGNNQTEKTQSEATETTSIENTQPVNNQSESDKTGEYSSAVEKIVLDYGDEESFEAALNTDKEYLRK